MARGEAGWRRVTRRLSIEPGITGVYAGGFTTDVAGPSPTNCSLLGISRATGIPGGIDDALPTAADAPMRSHDCRGGATSFSTDGCRLGNAFWRTAEAAGLAWRRFSWRARAGRALS